MTNLSVDMTAAAGIMREEEPHSSPVSSPLRPVSLSTPSSSSPSLSFSATKLRQFVVPSSTFSTTSATATSPGTAPGKKMMNVLSGRYIIGLFIVIVVLLVQLLVDFQWVATFQQETEMVVTKTTTMNSTNTKQQQQQRSPSSSRSTSNTGSTTYSKQQQSSPYEHVVFIGDDLLRNAYLEFVDQIHFRGGGSGRRTATNTGSTSSRSGRSSGDGGIAPNELIHESKHGNWIQFVQYTMKHFKGYMSCDCRPGGGVLDTTATSSTTLPNIENRFYSFGSMTATYLQGYGEYPAHGHYKPNDVSKAKFFTKSTTSSMKNDNKKISNYTWEYDGFDWDQFLLQYVAQLRPKPTAIILNAGTITTTTGTTWLTSINMNISMNMGRILQAAKYVVGEKGTVIWRESPTQEWNNKTKQNEPISVDQIAKDWSYRISDILYQPFPLVSSNISTTTITMTKSSSTTTGNQSHIDLYDTRFYRYWNNFIVRAIWDRPKIEQVAFLVVGAVRSLSRTHDTMMQNLVRKLCPPYRCIAHIIIHLSGADNRPDRNNPDPTGVAFRSNESDTTTGYFQNANQYDWPKDFLRYHHVESYEIGSPEEQSAMDQYENEYIQEEIDASKGSINAAVLRHNILNKFHVVRFGDPRRYSMWFARAWAWRFVKNLNISFDSYMFTRPDLLWYLPLPPLAFFRDFDQTGRDAWVHDRYYNDVPDTFALLTTADVADRYMSLRYLLHPDVFCLGGPGFDRSLVEVRLKKMNISVNETDWCTSTEAGWSEMILRMKMGRAHLHKRWFPAGVTIWRPPAHAYGFRHGMLLCEPVHAKFICGWVSFTRTNIPFYGCIASMYGIESNWSTVINRDNPNIHGVLSIQFFRWRSRTEQAAYCLTRVLKDENVTWASQPCQDPISWVQIYAKIPDDDQHWLGFRVQDEGSIELVTIPQLDNGLWFPEPIDMYHAHALDRVRRRKR